jgi:hypothetical protein
MILYLSQKYVTFDFILVPFRCQILALSAILEVSKAPMFNELLTKLWMESTFPVTGTTLANHLSNAFFTLLGNYTKSLGVLNTDLKSRHLD